MAACLSNQRDLHSRDEPRYHGAVASETKRFISHRFLSANYLQRAYCADLTDVLTPSREQINRCRLQRRAPLGNGMIEQFKHQAKGC
jgi:hypothetical protein